MDMASLFLRVWSVARGCGLSVLWGCGMLLGVWSVAMVWCSFTGVS